MAELTDEVRRFLDAPRYGVLATINPDGTPQQTVMWYALEGDTIMMNTKRGRQKDRNLLRDSRVSFCVEEGYTYVTLAGTIALEEDPEQAQRDIAGLAVRYLGEEGAEGSRQQFRRETRVTLRMTIERVDAHGFGGEG